MEGLQERLASRKGCPFGKAVLADGLAFGTEDLLDKGDIARDTLRLSFRQDVARIALQLTLNGTAGEC
jgi:hypothetical protein